MAKTERDIRSMARSHTQTCVRVLSKIATGSGPEGARVQAVQTLLAYGYGRPATVIVGDTEGGPVALTFSRMELARRMLSIIDLATNTNDDETKLIEVGESPQAIDSKAIEVK